MLLSRPDLALLLRKLTQSPPHASLADVASSCLEPFDRDDHFRVLCAVLLQLEDGAIADHAARCAALYLLVAAHGAAPLRTDPFLSYLLEAAVDTERPQVERAFLCRLLTGSLQVGKERLDSLTSAAGDDPASPLPDAAEVRRLAGASDEAGPSEPSAGSDGIRPPSAGPVLRQSGWRDELPWLYPCPRLEPLPLDGPDPEALAQAGALALLLRQAAEQPLMPAQQDAAIAALRANRKLAFRAAPDVAALPGLVEHNLPLAVALLLRLLPSPQGTQYLDALGSMPMSLHTVEAVSSLAAGGKLPRTFLGPFISRCVAACQSSQDTGVQGRLVRLLCVFLTSLLRRSAAELAALGPELQAFCVQFSRIREAAALFRMLKELETGDAAALSPS